VEAVDSLTDVSFDLELLLGDSGLFFCSTGFEVGNAGTEHGVLDLLSDHRADPTEVLSDPINFEGRPIEELEITEEIARHSTGGPRLLLPPGTNTVVDQDLLGPLSMPVDAAVALLEPIRVPRYLGVNHEVTVVLEVDAL
jgi:hypothetical protein